MPRFEPENEQVSATTHAAIVATSQSAPSAVAIPLDPSHHDQKENKPHYDPPFPKISRFRYFIVKILAGKLLLTPAFSYQSRAAALSPA